MRYLVVLMSCTLGCATRDPGVIGSVVVGAPASLRAPFEAIALGYKARHDSRIATLAFGTPAELFATGAPFDVIAADSADGLQPIAERLKGAERHDYASNPLCLLTRVSTVEARLATLAQATWVHKVALADPRQDRAAAAGEAALGRLGIRRALDGRLLYVGGGAAGVVRALLDGRAEAGLAHATALAAPEAREALKCADRAGDAASARYPIALVPGSARYAAAREFVDDLLHGEGQKRLAEHGLLSPSAAP